MDKKLFPTIKKSIDDLINDEEGNIPRGRVCEIKSVNRHSMISDGAVSS